MKKLFTLLALLLIIQGTRGQIIKATPGALMFRNTDENSAANRQVQIINTSPLPLSITDIDYFQTYDTYPFEPQDTAFFLGGNDTVSLTVEFHPDQNIDYSRILVIKTSNGTGHLVLPLSGQGTFSNSYYSSTRNLKEEPLKTALANLLSNNYNSLGYRSARDNMYASIDNNGGQVECVYTGRTATFNTRAGANSNQFNTEHTFPQGFYNQNEPMRSDIHHLFPTDVTANSRRGNDPFGLVNNANWSQGGSRSGGGKFEPRDQQKGVTARAMFYFVLRYQDYNNHFQGQEAILRTWHEQFPPGTSEQIRNQAIYQLQNNRNPFVDYPQLIKRINKIAVQSNEPSLKDLYRSDDTIFLAQGNGRAVFNFVLYNTGNQRLNFSNISVSDNRLNIVSRNFTQLGVAHFANIKIDYPLDENINATLEIAGDFPDASWSIPIISGIPLSHNDEELKESRSLFPNPATAYFRLGGQLSEQASIKLFDLKGKLVKQWRGPQSYTVDDLPAGPYQVEVADEAKQPYRQLLIIH